MDGVPVPLDLDAPNATLRVAMPAGTHVVAFEFGETNLRLLADGVSLVALVSVTLLAVRVWRQRSEEAKEQGGGGAEEQRRLKNEQLPCSPAPLLLCSLALIAFWFIAPHVGVVRVSPLPTIIGVQHPRADQLGDEMRLLGYDVSAASVTAGDALALTLYWQPLRVSQNDYAVFAHLDHPITLDTVAQTLNDHPGNISTVELPLALYVRDPHVLRVPTNIEPGLYWLRVGMINTRNNQALSVTQPDGSRRTRVLLQPIRVRRATPVDLNGVTRTSVRFGAIELIGYTRDAQSQLTLYWRATQAPNVDATVFVHWLDANNHAVATGDGPPTGGLLPVSAWDKDEVVVDRRTLTPSSGAVRIAVGLYDPQTLQRYAAVGADGRRLRDDQFVIEAQK